MIDELLRSGTSPGWFTGWRSEVGVIEVAPTSPDPYRRCRDLSDAKLREIVDEADAVLRARCWWGAQLNAQVSRRQALAELKSRGK